MSEEYLTDLLEDWFDSGNDSEYLEEANAAGLPNFIKNLFGHILKFMHQPERQTRSWVDTIVESISSIRDIIYDKKTGYKSLRLITDSYLDDRFAEGLQLLFKDTKILENYPRIPSWDIDFILNKNSAVKYWLFSCELKKNIKDYINEQID